MKENEKEIKICKSEVTIIQNEIDYDKLAQAIVKAQEKSTPKPESSKKIGFWKAIWLIIRNKEPQNGNKTAYILAEVMSYIFNTAAICCFGLTISLILASIFTIEWSTEIFTLIIQIAFAVLLSGTLLVTALIFRGIANEIKAEKDRNYITTLFFGFTSLASLIVALIALYKGVG